MSRKQKNSPRAKIDNPVRPPNKRLRTWSIVTLVIVGIAGLVVYANWPPSQSSPTIPDFKASQEKGIDPAVLKAVGTARQQVVDHPQSSVRWSHLGLVFTAHDFLEEAADCFAVASKLAPDNLRWAYLHARCRFPSAPDEALSLLEKCAERNDDPLDAPRLFLVEKLMELQRLDEAEYHLARALDQYPENARARFAKARLYFLRQEFEACRNQILKTQRAVQDRYEAEIERVKKLNNESQQANANASLQAANKRLRESSCQQKNIGSMLAATMFRLGDEEGGRQQEQLAKQKTDTNWPDPYTAGISKLKTGLRTMLSKSDIAYSHLRYDEALDILNQAVAQYPESMFARIRLGRTHIRLGRTAQEANDSKTALVHYKIADHQLDSALSIDANSVEAHFRKGVLTLYWTKLPLETKSVSQAEQHFRKAISIKPDFPMAYFNLARCLDKQQKPVEAIAAMRASLEFDPNHLPARRGLGGLLMKAGQLEEAILQLEQVVDKQPDDQQARGWLHMMRQDVDSK